MLFPKDGPSPYAVVVQPDGKIVAAGGEYSLGVSGKPWFLERINGDGTIDTGFRASLAGWLPSVGEAHATSVLQSSGKIMAAGDSDKRLTVLRVTASGAPDVSFGKNGIFKADGFSDPTNSSGHALNVLANGDFFLAGRRTTGNGDVGFVERYLQNGARDLRFPSHLTSTPVNYRGVFAQPDGTVVAVGDDGTQQIAVRLLASGTPDSAFGESGFRTYAQGCQADDAILAPNGDIVVVGREGALPASTCVTRIAARERGEARYSMKKGSARYPDTAVGIAGELTYVSSSGGGPDEAWISTVERYLPDGKLDQSFAKGGTLRLDAVVAGTSAPKIRAIATLPDGRLILAGLNVGGPFVARYWP